MNTVSTTGIPLPSTLVNSGELSFFKSANYIGQVLELYSPPFAGKLFPFNLLFQQFVGTGLLLNLVNGTFISLFTLYCSLFTFYSSLFTAKSLHCDYTQSNEHVLFSVSLILQNPPQQPIVRGTFLFLVCGEGTGLG